MLLANNIKRGKGVNYQNDHSLLRKDAGESPYDKRTHKLARHRAATTAAAAPFEARQAASKCLGRISGLLELG